LTSAKKVALVRLAEQSKQAVYTETEELHDFCELVVQFAFVTFFMPVFPLVGLYALLNNVVEMKTDSFKLINPHGFQRPFARRYVIKYFSLYSVYIQSIFSVKVSLN
jgi:hypothetical protein